MINNKNKLNTLTARMLDKNVPNVGVMSLAVCLSVCLFLCITVKQCVKQCPATTASTQQRASQT